MKTLWLLTWRGMKKRKAGTLLLGGAVALSASLKTEFEARSLDVIALVEGNPKKSGPFVEHVEQVIDEAMNEYAKPVEIEVTFTAEQEADAESDDE